MEFDFEYLKHLIQETIKISDSFEYFNVNENDCEISYISNNNKTSMVLQQGLMCQFDCINYVLNGTRPILGTESGIFTLNPELMYTLIETSN